jgi:hypothetical protein
LRHGILARGFKIASDTVHDRVKRYRCTRLEVVRTVAM